jgi:hypothetical protein
MADTLESLVQWAVDNQHLKGTPEFQAKAEQYKQLANPQVPQYTPSEGEIKPWGPPDINYAAPVEDVRTSLNTLPQADRTAGWNKWADQQEAQQNAAGGVKRKLNDVFRGITQGVPLVGPFADRINAGVASILPSNTPSWLADARPYEEQLALEQARNRRNMAEHPVETPLLNATGAVGSAFVAPGLRGPGVGSVVGNTAIDTGIAAVGGVGNSPDLTNTGAVVKHAEQDAGMTAPISLAVNTLMRSLGRYTDAIPAVARAAEQLGIKLPFFAQAESRAVQGEGRRYAQHAPDERLNKSWEGANTALDTTAGDTASRAAGSTEVGMAPYQAGSTVNPALQGAIDAGQAEKGRLSGEINNLLPDPNQRFDFPATRDTTQRMVREREGAGAVNPQAGLGDQLRFTDRPPPTAATMGPWGQRGGSTFEESMNHATELGQRIGLPISVPRDVSDARLEAIYGALRGDQRGVIRQAGGPGAEAQFVGNVEQQRLISDGQRAISDAMKDRPEAVINLIHGATTVKGTGTDINALTTVLSALPAGERRVLGGGVLGKIVNDANGSPAKIASALEAMPDAARSMIFPPGSRIAGDVDNILTVSRQLGQVNAAQDVGSAKTLGLRMAGKNYGGFGPGGLATMGLGWALGMPKEAGVALAAGTGAAGLYNQVAKPYLLQHGLSPELTQAIGAAMRGTARSTPNIYDSTPLGRER